MKLRHLFDAVVVAGLVIQLLAPATSTAQGRAAAVAIAAARMRPGDIVRVRVWREPDYSGDFVIDEHGTITLPRLGTRPVVDQSPDVLKGQLLADYAKWLQDPTIEVTILRRVNVIGAVARPGLYPADPTISLIDLLAMAGGPSPNGVTDKVELVRNGQRTTLLLTEALPPTILAVESGDQLYVPERSWLSRNVIVIPVIVGALASIYTAIHR